MTPLATCFTMLLLLLLLQEWLVQVRVPAVVVLVGFSCLS
jgi:hypothetical protein